MAVVVVGHGARLGLGSLGLAALQDHGAAQLARSGGGLAEAVADALGGAARHVPRVVGAGGGPPQPHGQAHAQGGQANAGPTPSASRGAVHEGGALQRLGHACLDCLLDRPACMGQPGAQLWLGLCWTWPCMLHAVCGYMADGAGCMGFSRPCMRSGVV